MLEILFFPFSHLSGHQVLTMETLFPEFAYIPVASDLETDHPLPAGVKDHKIKPVRHSKATLESLKAHVASFRQWARIHQGNEKNLKFLLKDRPFFREDDDLTSIQSQLKGRVDRKEGEPAAGNKDETAAMDPLLFLEFARILDQENETIDDELQNLEKTRTELFSQLKGIDGSPNSLDSPENHQDPRRNDPGLVMTGQRVASWFKVAAAKKLFENSEIPKVLVTTSPAVYDYLCSNSKDVINGLDNKSIKVHEDECPLRKEWQSQFCSILETMIKDRGCGGKDLPEAEDECSISVQMRLGIFPEHTNLLDMPDLKLSGKNIGICLVRLES